MYRNVAITSWELSTDAETSFSMVNDDIVLSDSIDEYFVEYLLPKGIEMFEKQGNVIVTDDGYYGAFYDDELEDASEEV